MGYEQNNNALTDSQLNRLRDICSMAETEGWSIFNTGRQDATHNPFELQRIDEDAVFSSDDEAIKFVVDKAAECPNSFYANAIEQGLAVVP